MESSGDLKRDREEENPVISSPEAKRLRDDLFFDDIFDDDDDADTGDQDLASVMKSLEDEIGWPSPPPAQPEAAVAIGQPDLGYLFEASDDELGLPPAPPVAPSSDKDAVGAAVMVREEELDGTGFDPIWGLDDEINGYYGMEEFSIRPERPVTGTEDGVVFDVGLLDLPDLSWRSETLPAI